LYRFIWSTLTVLAVLLAVPLIAIAANVLQTQSTASYNVTLVIGPSETMLMPDAAKGATSGEVMAAMPGMPMGDMPTTDAGHPVNHHLEVHLVNKSNGKVVTDTPPTINITDTKTGVSRAVSPVAAMYGATAGPSDWHFGGNVYLADGTYTVAVIIAGEAATFSNVAVAGSPAPAAPTPTAMAMPTPAPTPVPAAPALPRTGGFPSASTPIAAALALLCAGVALRRRSRRAR
jgi:hypothetical protein